MELPGNCGSYFAGSGTAHRYVAGFQVLYPAARSVIRCRCCYCCRNSPTNGPAAEQRRFLWIRLLEQEVDGMKAGSRALAAASSLSLVLFITSLAIAQQSGGILKISHFDSPAS